MKERERGMVVFSGGMDSATLAYYCASLGWDVSLISFNYGQRHHKELEYAAALAAELCAPHVVVDLDFFIGGSALTDNIAVPNGHYAEETMKATVVPNRNAMMLSVAFAAALGGGIETVAAAFHAGDHFIYPDCRPAFTIAYQEMIRTATEGFYAPTLYTPFLDQTKAQIAEMGAALGVPFDLTWSCYNGEALHCGTCGTCVERREAFILAQVVDPTDYQNADPLPAAPLVEAV